MKNYQKPLPYDRRMDDIMDRVRKSADALGSPLPFRKYISGMTDWRFGLVDTKGSNVTVVGDKKRFSLGIGVEGDVHIWSYPVAQGNLNIGEHIGDGDLTHSYITPDEMRIEFIDEHGALWRIDVDPRSKAGTVKRTARPTMAATGTEARLCQ
jgi:hypothetical protein